MAVDMAWNDQNTPVSGPVPAYGPAPPAPGAAPVPPGQQYPGGYSPPATQQASPPMATPPPGYVGSYAQNPLAVPNGRPASPLQPLPQRPAANQIPGARPSYMPTAAGEGDRIDAGDDIWIERAKKAIAETQNDPHRQVQLLQHLNKLYLKERFGREVQADQA